MTLTNLQIKAAFGPNRHILWPINTYKSQSEAVELKLTLRHISSHLDALISGKTLYQFAESADMYEPTGFNRPLPRILCYVQ